MRGSARPHLELRSVRRHAPRAKRAFSRRICAGSRRPKEFIYLETQYFTNDAIGDGLVNAMQREPQLKVIVLLNIEPDVPTYPVQAAAADHADPQGDRPDADRTAALRRVHAVDARGRPAHRARASCPVYIHAKVGDHRQHLGDGRLGQPRRPVARLVVAERHPERVVPPRRAAGHRGQRRCSSTPRIRRTTWSTSCGASSGRSTSAS